MMKLVSRGVIEAARGSGKLGTVAAACYAAR